MMESSRANIVVTASAGTGKTYRLVSEFVSAVLGSEGNEPIHPRRVLALTFTEKAAAEMKVRISARLSESEVPKSQKLRGFIRDLDQAHITTYHSFCARILRDYARELELDSRYQLLDTFEEAELATRVGKQLVLRELERAGAPLLSLIARLGLLGVVDYLVRVREQLIESGLDPARVPTHTVPTFAAALRDCFDAFSAYDAILPTLTSTAQERVKRAREAFGAVVAVLNESEADSLEIRISSAFSALRESLSGRFGPDAPRKALVGAVSSLGSLLCASFVKPEADAFHALLSAFWVELEAAKKRSMCLAFGDLLVLTRRLLRENLNVRKELKARFDRVLVDEYQDTSPIQEDIVALLCEVADQEQTLESTQPALSHLQLAPGKLFVVGDPKQSIYGFRGSDVTLFKRMTETISRQGGALESLNISRRSSADVVEVVNLAVSCDDVEKLVPMRDRVGIAGAILKCSDESLALASQISVLLGEGFEPQDIAILVRRIKKATPILQELLGAGIPARIWGGDGFFESQEVVELIAALQLTLDPLNNLAWLTVMRSPLIGFDDFYWARLFASLQSHSETFTLAGLQHAVAEKIFDEALHQRFEVFFAWVEWIQSNVLAVSAAEAFERLLQLNSYLQTVSSQAEANIQKLRGMLIESEGDFTSQVAGLVQKVKQGSKEPLGEEKTQPNTVRIMTIHQSKGLEFPVVFLADTIAAIPSDTSDLLFDDRLGLALSHRGRPIAVCAPESSEWVDRFPTPIQAVRARQREKNEAELERLLYVALTRARDRIYVVDSRECDESGNAKHRGKTLLSLFMEGVKDHLPTLSDFVMPAQATIQISPPSMDASLRWHDKREARKLLFASNLFLLASQGELRADRLVYQPAIALHKEHSASERGRIAHELIRSATEQLSLSEYEDPDTIRRVLDASLRMMGCSGEPELIEDCVATLEAVVWPLLKAEFVFEFEVPMLYEDPRFVVKGFADAIATRGDIRCLIDFKSSSQAAQSEKTALQLLAYCASLGKSSSRVFYSSCVIGDRTPLEFQPFDEAGRQKFSTHIEQVLSS